MSTIDEQKNCTISLAFSQGANSVLSMERNNAVLFSSHRKRGHVLFCRSMYPPSPDKEEKRNRPKADGPLLSIPAANRHGYPTRPHRSSRISIHDPRAGIDVQSSPQTYQSVVFQSTTPVRGSTARLLIFCGTVIISIHDPRAGIDLSATHVTAPPLHFNPRPPCGDRPVNLDIRYTFERFQSTTPVWGSTPAGAYILMYDGISIHDPRVGIDIPSGSDKRRDYDFNPRPPCGDRLFFPWTYLGTVMDFNPRPPCGDRRRKTSCTALNCKFQSTTPVWGSTSPRPQIFAVGIISIHDPRVGIDCKNS